MGTKVFIDMFHSHKYSLLIGEDVFINERDTKKRDKHTWKAFLNLPNPGCWPAGDKNATVVTPV